MSDEARPAPAVSAAPSWKGRVAAALIGGTLLSWVLGLAVTIYVPGHDGLDEAFLGGLALVSAWPIAILWTLFATTTWRAWRRVLIPTLLLLVASVAGLLL